jgi:cobalt/nickel transport system permease protein
MADALVSPAVGGVMLAVGVGSVALSVKKMADEKTLDEKKAPMMGVMGAFVFAAQMVNIAIPGTGSSGHIGGGILLAATLGKWPALIVISSVLLIQCLFFADGGLLAYGCNVFNMGIIPCLVAYPLIFKTITKRGFTRGRIILASILAVVVALQLGPFGVVLETTASGITRLPFGTFAALMQPIHLAIGLVEGVITAAVLVFIREVRPEALESAASGTKISGGVSVKKFVVIFSVFAVIIGGSLSLLASSHPDGLEWAIRGVTGSTELDSEGGVHKAAADAVEATAIMPDYDPTGNGSLSGTALAGIVGGAFTVALAGGVGLVIYLMRRRKIKPEANGLDKADTDTEA